MEKPQSEKFMEMTLDQKTRIQTLANDHHRKGWIDQAEVDKILSIKSFEDAEDYCEQRMSNYVGANVVFDAGLITKEAKDELIKMDPYEAFEKIQNYRKQLA